MRQILVNTPEFIDSKGARTYKLESNKIAIIPGQLTILNLALNVLLLFTMISDKYIV